MIRREGFYHSESEPDLPLPIENEETWPEQLKFLKKLVLIQEQAKQTRYRGLEFCRICNKSIGKTTYSNKEWEWHRGIFHYTLIHNVKPSEEFLQYILKF
jgi:hypothetical protein